ncbi:MAG: hypothetical protein WBN44_13475 [Woeseiaceae bacterium]
MPILKLFKRKSLGSAAAETVLIMFGVLAALALQSWWDDKVEQQTLLSHLTAVQEELREGTEAIAENLRRSGLVVDRTGTVMTMLADTQSETLPDLFVESVSAMYSISGPDIPMSAYDAFVSSGSLRLVKNRTLRAMLAKYTNEVEDVGHVHQALWNVYYDLQVPFLNRNFVLSDFGWSIETEDAFGERISSLGEIPTAPDSPDWDSIRSLEFWNLVYTWRIAYNDQIAAVIRLQRHCNHLQDLLQAEIKRLE